MHLYDIITYENRSFFQKLQYDVAAHAFVSFFLLTVKCLFSIIIIIIITVIIIYQQYLSLRVRH